MCHVIRELICKFWALRHTAGLKSPLPDPSYIGSGPDSSPPGTARRPPFQTSFIAGADQSSVGDLHLNPPSAVAQRVLSRNYHMTTAAGFLVQCSGSFLISSYRPPICRWKFERNQFQLVKISRKPLWHSFHICRHIKCKSTGRTSRQGLSSDQESFWLTMLKDTAWSLRSLAIFLAEQPSQLKYIEWPSFQNTLKTASLTLVLVALLIVALSSIDSLLSFILALFLRKPA